jgi:hypothetical protein
VGILDDIVNGQFELPSLTCDSKAFTTSGFTGQLKPPPEIQHPHPPNITAIPLTPHQQHGNTCASTTSQFQFMIKSTSRQIKYDLPLLNL